MAGHQRANGHPGNPLFKALSLVFLFIILAALGFRFWASGESAARTGPTHIAASSKAVFLIADDHLYQLSAEGVTQQRIHITDIGLADDPIDLLLLDDGRLILAAQQPARLRVCNTERWECESMPLPLNAPPRQFKLIPDGPGYLVTDAAEDTLWRYDPVEVSMVPQVEDDVLAGANGIEYVSDGSWWVADTDKRRVLELTRTGDRLEPAREHSAHSEWSVGNRVFPIMIKQSRQGHLWVTLADEGNMGRSDLAVFDPGEGAIARVDIPGSEFLADLSPSGGQMLVTDLEAALVFSVDTVSHSVAQFGDKAFRDHMQAILNQRARYASFSAVSLMAVAASGVLMILFAVLATPYEQRWTPQPDLAGPVDEPLNDGQAAEPIQGIHWLKRASHVDKVLKWVPVIFFGALALLACCSLALYFVMAQGARDSDKLVELALVLLGVNVLFWCLAPMILATMRVIRRIPGSDGRYLHIQLEDGRRLRVEPTQLNYTNRLLLYRQYSIPLKDGRQRSLYQKGEVRAYLAPLLQKAKRLSGWEGVKHQFRHRDPQFLWVVLSTALLCAATLVLVVLK